jgi:RecB family exonuclease
LAKLQCFGNIVHTVLENVISNDSPLDYSEIETEYQKSKESHDPDQKISEQLITVGKEILDEFYDQNINTEFNIYDKEYGFKFVLGNHLIIGFIDRIDVFGDEVRIVDYKTGKWEVSQKSIPNNLQLGIYAIAASELFPDKTITAELYYLRSGKHKSHTYTKDDLERLKQDVIDAINEIINDNSFAATANSRACSYCDHAKSGACGTGVFRNKKAAGA